MAQMSIPENRTMRGNTPLPNETWSQFLERTGIYKSLPDKAALAEVEDAFKVAQLQQAQEAKSRGVLEEQKGVQSQRLGELTSLLAKQQDAKFNREIPGIAETAQAGGFLETSGFGNSLANRYKELTAETSEALARQSLTDRDLEVTSLGAIGKESNATGTAGLERTFSTEDLSRSEILARELAKYGVPAPAKEPSTFDKTLQYAGPVLSGVGAVKGAN